MPPRRWKPIAVEAALAIAVIASAGLWFGIHGPQRAAHEIAALGDHTSTRILFTALYATGLAIGLPVGSLSVVGGAEFGWGLGFVLDMTAIVAGAAAGYTLAHSSGFQALLPNDGYTNFSAIFYHNIGPVVGPLAAQLKASGALNRQQQQSVDALTANSAPGLIYAYGEPDRIVVASNTGFMGFDLGTLLTMGHNGPFLPQMFLGGAMNPSTPPTQ